MSMASGAENKTELAGYRLVSKRLTSEKTWAAKIQDNTLILKKTTPTAGAGNDIGLVLKSSLKYVAEMRLVLIAVLAVMKGKIYFTLSGFWT